MKKKILVIGVGSGGLLTLSQLCFNLNSEWEVHSVHDPKIPILGVGEATSTGAPMHLFLGTDFILERDGHYLDATYKYSVKYTNWRKDAFDSVILPPGHAMHFNNTKLKSFVFMRLLERYPGKFKTIEGAVKYFENTGSAVEVKIDDTLYNYDYVIDCSGFPKDYSNYEMVDLPINHALVTSIDKPGDWNYTHHWAHKNGWMFGIPLQTRQGWGYMYNDTITSKEDAMEDMCDILNINPNLHKFKEYSFKPYYTVKSLIQDRILKNGNQYMFFEPMEALSMEYYVALNLLYIKMFNGEIGKEGIEERTQFDIDSLILFYRFMYHGGSIYDTEFWRATKKNTGSYLENDKEFKNKLHFWRINKDDPRRSIDMIIPPFKAYTWEQFDKNLNYKYFTDTA